MPVVAFSRTYGLGARWRNPATRKDKNDLYQHAVHEERKQREEEESNRLFYVAMTRARRRLIISYHGENGDGKKQEPSRFLAVLPTESCQTL